MLHDIKTIIKFTAARAAYNFCIANHCNICSLLPHGQLIMVDRGNCARLPCLLPHGQLIIEGQKYLSLVELLTAAQAAEDCLPRPLLPMYLFTTELVADIIGSQQFNPVFLVLCRTGSLEFS